jgi:hypothetical protein
MKEKRKNPLLDLDFDKIDGIHIERDLGFVIRVSMEGEATPRIFEFESEAEMDAAHDEYYGLPPYDPNPN